MRVATLRLPPACEVEDSIRRRLDAGFTALALEEPLSRSDAETVLVTVPRAALFSVGLFLPAPRGLRPGAPLPFASAAVSRDERSDAIRHGCETLRFADQHQVRIVRVPPTALDPEDAARIRSAASRSQDSVVRQTFSAYLSSLSSWLEIADRYDLRLALTPGRTPIEVPAPAEIIDCIAEFRGAPLGLWLSAQVELEATRAGATPLHERAADLVVALEIDRKLLVSASHAETRTAVRPLLELAPATVVDPQDDTSNDAFAAAFTALDSLAAEESFDPFL